MRQLSPEFKKRHTLRLANVGSKQYIYCGCCDKPICEPKDLELQRIKVHCGDGNASAIKHGAKKHNANLEEYAKRISNHPKQMELYEKIVPRKNRIPDMDERQFRYDMTHGLLKASTPFAHADTLKDPISKWSFYSMPGADVLSRVKPVVTAFEKYTIKTELGTDVELPAAIKNDVSKSPLVNVIFDGTERGGDNQAIIFRFVVHTEGSKPEVVQRCVALENAKVSVNGRQLARMIRDQLVSWGVNPEIALVFTNRDNCSTNGKCIDVLKAEGGFKNLFDSSCWSHLGNNTGNALFNPPKKSIASANVSLEQEYDEDFDNYIDVKTANFPVLRQQNSHYAPTCSSHNAMDWFKTITGVRDKQGLSTVRWFAKYDNIHQKCGLGYDKVRTWSDKLNEIGMCSKSAPKLSKLLHNPALFYILQVEAVTYIIFSEGLRELTYRLEGDGHLSLVAYSIIFNLVYKKFKGDWTWLIRDERWDSAVDDALTYQDAAPAPAAVVASEAAEKEYIRLKNVADKGPCTSNGTRLRKKLTIHSNESAEIKNRRKAEHLLLWQKEKDTLDKAAEDAYEIWITAMSKAPPQTKEEYETLMIKYCLPARQYFLDHVEKDYALSFNIFKHIELIGNGRQAKSCGIEEMNTMIETIFELLPVLNNWPDKDEWKRKLKETFPKLKSRHISEYMDDKHKIGDIVDVKYKGYPVPRVAEITAIPGITNDTYTVKYKGKLTHSKTDHKIEENVSPGRITRKVDDFLEYYYEATLVDIDFTVWLELIEIFVLLQPSSAAAERIFSQLAGRFSKQQMSLIQNSIWTTIALIFHKRTV